MLAAISVFCDEEPRWARLLVDDSAVGTRAISERRQKALAAITRALAMDMQADASSSGWFVPSSQLTAELVVGGIFSVLRMRLSDGVREPFAELAPSLTAFALGSHRASSDSLEVEEPSAASEDGLSGQRLPVRTTYRTTRVLSVIGDSPGLSNRDIAEAAGLSDEGQTSKLLRRLERRGLVENYGLGQASGGPNAWLLTAYGERVRDVTRHSLVPGAGAVIGRRLRGTT